MMRSLKYGLGTTVAYAFVAQAAYADLTAQDVWGDWRTYMSSLGYEVTASEQVSGDTLTVSDLAMTMPVPEGNGTVAVVFSSLEFTENSDGTVNVGFPASIPVTFDMKPPGDDPVSGEVAYSQTGSVMVVSGDPANMLYNYTAAQIDVALKSLTVDGAPVPAEIAKFSMSMANMVSSMQMTIGDLRSYSQRINMDSLSYDFAFNDPESSDQGAFKGALQNLGFQGTGNIPKEMDPSNFQSMLEDGFAIDGMFSYSAGNTDIQGNGDGEQFSATSSSQGGELSVAMDASRIAYNGSQTGASISVTTSAMPFPISMDMAVAGFKLMMPVAKSDEEQDFAFGLNMTEFTMSDMIWGMFDPTSALPRDPATIALDLSGKAKILFDFLDPKVAAVLESSDQPPGELNALTINQLLVSMVGAKLTGTGDFTFDNSDTTTYGGMPKPTGFVELELVGANGLLDKIVQMGFVSDQDAMGARMMMGMLAVPGQGEDTLTSRLEINDQGHIMANGQRIQ